MKKPAPNILDKGFCYTPAASTTPEYLRKKFRRIQQELQKETLNARQENVTPFKKAQVEHETTSRKRARDP